MWCPSVSLSVWSNAWLAGRAAPDDVLDALNAWAPIHSVTAYDAVAAGRTGLPWPDVDNAGPMSLLQTVRTATGPRRLDGPAGTSISLALPVPGDVRGLPVGTQFQTDALDAGEAVIVSSPDGTAIGLVPAFEVDDEDAPLPRETLLWSVYSLPNPPVADYMDLGEAEYALRSAVRSAADALDGLRLVAGAEDPRSLVEEVLQATCHHGIPEHAPSRAVRVLSTAAHVDAIITVSSGVAPIGTQSASEARIADSALRPLSSVVRAARAAAVSAILESAWRR
ncbi:hypothetical protein [Mycolicibacterium sp.]|uniref:hypothetical protein n=1 Tax=Mycolicibacterium sp. TaxID=2320850 RepID=UPI0028AB0165|nr:hypothetical protein [Mycolicibacterium sp.]